MSRRVVLETHAYNAEKTVERTILSVLAQTYENWEWHIYENGATDKTGEIIKKYAEQDSRIRHYSNRSNNPLNTYLFLASHANFKCYSDDDCFTYICADDTFEPEYMQEMLAFLSEHYLDVGSCISKYTDAVTGELKNKFMLQENIFCRTPEDFSNNFQTLYPFYRELWGHMITFKVLRCISYAVYAQYLNARAYSFLALNLEILTKANSVGILAKPLHTYYVSSNSLAHRAVLKISRQAHFSSLATHLKSFLIKKCGCITKSNHVFVLSRTLKSMNDYLPILFKAPDEVANLLFLHKMLSFGSTLEAFNNAEVSRELKEEFCKRAYNWLKEVLINKKLEKPIALPDRAGEIEYLASGGVDSLGYKLINPQNVSAPTVISYALDIHNFIAKHCFKVLS